MFEQRATARAWVTWPGGCQSRARSCTCRLFHRRGAGAQRAPRPATHARRRTLHGEQGMPAVSPLAGVKFGRPAKRRERYLSVRLMRLSWTNSKIPSHDDYKTIYAPATDAWPPRQLSVWHGARRNEMDARISTIPSEPLQKRSGIKSASTEMARKSLKKILRRAEGPLCSELVGNPDNASIS